jgi:acid phosphatase family membrane protein YuiD
MIGLSSQLSHRLDGECHVYRSSNRWLNKGTRACCRDVLAVARSKASDMDTASSDNQLNLNLRILSLRIKRLGMAAERLRQHSPPVMSLAAFPVMALSDLLSNQVFMSGLIGFLAAQIGKIFTERYKRGYWNLMAFTQPGGTPSSHSSLCTGITTAIALVQGLGSPLFATALAFSVVVMYDAQGVRWHAGKHAQVLNRVISDIQERGNNGNGDQSKSSLDEVVQPGAKLKEVLGHTPRQVGAGAVVGFIAAIFYHWIL